MVLESYDTEQKVEIAGDCPLGGTVPAANVARFQRLLLEQGTKTGALLGRMLGGQGEVLDGAELNPGRMVIFVSKIVLFVCFSVESLFT